MTLVTAAPLHLTVQQVAQHAHDAGFRGDALVTIVAIAGAETGGRYDAHAVGDRNLTEHDEQSTGLWQVNYRPSRDKGDAVRDPRRNLDPAHNARSAYAISSGGTRFTPWSTYGTSKGHNNAYTRYLADARSAVAAITETGDSSSPIVYRSVSDIDAIPVRIGGLAVAGELGTACVGGSVELTTAEASQLTLTFLDPDFTLLSNYKFTAGTVTEPGTLIEHAGLRFRITSVATEPRDDLPHTVLTAQPSGVVKLRRFVPPSLREISATDYAAIICQQQGLNFRGEQTSSRSSIGPAQVNDTATGKARSENAWELLRRLASELGFLCFESGGTVYFGSGSFLARLAKRWQLSVRGYSLPEGALYGEIVKGATWPRIRTTGTGLGGYPQRTVDVDLPRAVIERVRAGDQLLPLGVPTLDGSPTLTITRVSWDLADLVSPGKLSAADRDLSQVITGNDPTTGAIADANATPVTVDEDVYGTTRAGAATPNSKRAVDFVSFCLMQVGDKYVWGAHPSPTSTDPDAFDCSGLVGWAAGRTGVAGMAGNSHMQFLHCQAKGTLMPIEDAVLTRGALLFEATAGHAHHVAVSLGDGRHTVEARGRKYGVVEAPVAARPWTYAARIPGMRYA